MRLRYTERFNAVFHWKSRVTMFTELIDRSRPRLDVRPTLRSIVLKPDDEGTRELRSRLDERL